MLAALPLGLSWPLPASSAGVDTSHEAAAVERLDARVRLSQERVTFPGNEHVGLLGTTYLVDLPGGLSLGPALYGADAGQRGGFFTFGMEAAWHRRVLGPLRVELGLYAGGGGGSGSPQGGGLMLRPHADLLWGFGRYEVGASLARVKFPNGKIDSTQWGLVVTTATQFAFVPAGSRDEDVVGSGGSGFGFDRIALVAGAYRSRAGATLLDGRTQPRSIATLGVRVEQQATKNAYWGLEASGAAQPGAAGYAEYLATLGFEGKPLGDELTLGTRVALGIGGGGGIRVGSGLLTKAAAYAVVRVNPSLGLLTELGVIDAPRGDFRATSVSVGLRWTLDDRDAGALRGPAVPMVFATGLEAFDAARHSGVSRRLVADVLTIDRFVAGNFYLSGQVHSAISGDAGGYSAALVGIGWRQPLSARWHVGAELLGGAAGGGGVASHGLIGQATASVGFQVTPTVAINLGVGHVDAIRGPLNSNLVQASVSASFGVSGAR